LDIEKVAVYTWFLNNLIFVFLLFHQHQTFRSVEINIEKIRKVELKGALDQQTVIWMWRKYQSGSSVKILTSIFLMSGGLTPLPNFAHTAL